jgi:hypothetical protein
MAETDRLSAAAAELLRFARAGLRIESFGQRLQLIEGAESLTALPAVRAAGPDTTARFEYLAQAVVDAIDELSRTGTSADEGSNGRHPEAAALRHLFGLTEQTRRASWRARQEIAAHQLHVSWEHFRRGRQSLLLRAVTERLLSNALNEVPAPVDFRASLVAVSSQHEMEASLVSYVNTQRPARADLIELSTATTLPVLRALRNVQSQVRLLVCHPSMLQTTRFMTERLHQGFGDLFEMLDEEPFFEVRAYRVPPSLRGRSIGSLIAVGWYTYRDNKRLELSEGSTTEVWGHDNALIVGDISNPHGGVLASWFNREFDRLWAHRLTCDGAELRDLPR